MRILWLRNTPDAMLVLFDNAEWLRYHGNRMAGLETSYPDRKWYPTSWDAKIELLWSDNECIFNLTMFHVCEGNQPVIPLMLGRALKPLSVRPESLNACPLPLFVLSPTSLGVGSVILRPKVVVDQESFRRLICLPQHTTQAKDLAFPKQLSTTDSSNAAWDAFPQSSNV